MVDRSDQENDDSKKSALNGEFSPKKKIGLRCSQVFFSAISSAQALRLLATAGLALVFGLHFGRSEKLLFPTPGLDGRMVG